MDQEDHFYRMPALRHTENGSERHVGIEIELTGPDVRELVDHVQHLFGGDRVFHSEFEWEVVNSSLGRFRIELDSDLLKKVGRQEEASGEWLDHLASLALGGLSKGLVPCEIVSPPVPLSRLAEMSALVERLRRGGARGTRDAIWTAFGLHLNPEVPSLSTESILGYLRAFLCLHDWLKVAEDVDISRRLSPYIRPFGADYVKLVLQPDYHPDRDTLIDDYLQYNPTRNRALDFLPLFAHLDEARVRRTVDSVLIKPRPTYHYRLPNCDIDDPTWGIHRSWNRWCTVEALAADTKGLAEISAAYLEHLDSLTPDFLDPWAEKVLQWL